MKSLFGSLLLAAALTLPGALSGAVIFSTYNPGDATSVDTGTSETVQYKSNPGVAWPWQWGMSQVSVFFTPSQDTVLGEVMAPLAFRHGTGNVRAFLYSGTSAARPVNENKGPGSGGPLLGAAGNISIADLPETGFANVTFDFGGTYNLNAGTEYQIVLRTPQFHNGGVYWFANDGSPDYSADTYFYREAAQNHAILGGTGVMDFTPAIIITDGIIPEPSALSLLAVAGFGGLLFLRRRA